MMKFYLDDCAEDFFGEVYQVEKKLGIDTCLDMNIYAARVAKRRQYNVELKYSIEQMVSGGLRAVSDPTYTRPGKGIL